MSDSNNPAELTPPRRIITGHNAEGKAVVLYNEPVPVQTHGDVRFMSVWSSEGAPTRDNVDKSRTIDYNILLKGQLVLIMDDDVRTEVGLNDAVIQRGTRHAWHNPSKTEWSRWVTVLVHAEPIERDGKPLEDLWEV
ncbi:hypothetical protein Clacol_003021 [Clathrus columnatus]|uniref:Cupin 2 conserved barrel domain-containing protein n=1 Tax=Clathrus columnatus TaxID=1419009 RepID=A0AAV5A5P1_9AGAM|nr:hypothetical protein Clacol_003021 [Clathrus columnatus]